MISFLTDKLLNYVIGKKAIDGTDADEVSFYKYGIEITVSSSLNVLIIIAVSVLFNAIPEGLIFLSTFIPIRQFTGGFHADSYLRCNITFGTCYLLILIISRHTCVSLFIWLCLLLADTVFAAVFCPIKNEHKPITDKNQFLRLKLVGTISFIVYGIIGLLLINYRLVFGNVILFTLQSIAVLGIFGVIKERRINLLYTKGE